MKDMKETKNRIDDIMKALMKKKKPKGESEDEDMMAEEEMCPECKGMGEDCKCESEDRMALSKEAPQLNKTYVVADEDEEDGEDDMEMEEEDEEEDSKPQLFKKKMLLLVGKGKKK